MKEQLANLFAAIVGAKRYATTPEMRQALDLISLQAEQLANAARAGDVGAAPPGDRDVHRYRTLTRLLQRAYDGQAYEQSEPHLTADAQMVMGRRDYRLVTATITWSDVRDEPLDLGAALDTVPNDLLSSNS